MNRTLWRNVAWISAAWRACEPFFTTTQFRRTSRRRLASHSSMRPSNNRAEHSWPRLRLRAHAWASSASVAGLKLGCAATCLAIRRGDLKRIQRAANTRSKLSSVVTTISATLADNSRASKVEPERESETRNTKRGLFVTCTAIRGDVPSCSLVASVGAEYPMECGWVQWFHGA